MVILNDCEPIIFDNMIAGEEFEEIVDAVLPDINLLEQPDGNEIPDLDEETGLFKRDPYVKAYILKISNWICEYCDGAAPFNKDNGNPYLEVHHMKHLALGGSDRIQNTIALCPNCHRQFHFGNDRDKLYEKAYKKIERLIKE